MLDVELKHARVPRRGRRPLLQRLEGVGAARPYVAPLCCRGCEVEGKRARFGFEHEHGVDEDEGAELEVGLVRIGEHSTINHSAQPPFAKYV